MLNPVFAKEPFSFLLLHLVPSSLGIKSLEFNSLLGLGKPEDLQALLLDVFSRYEALSSVWLVLAASLLTHSFLHLSHLLLSARPPTSKKAICNVTPNFISHVAAMLRRPGFLQGRAKKALLSSVTHVPSGLMGCASAALG